MGVDVSACVCINMCITLAESLTVVYRVAICDVSIEDLEAGDFSARSVALEATDSTICS